MRVKDGIDTFPISIGLNPPDPFVFIQVVLDALLILALMVGGIIYTTQLLPTHDNRAVAEDLI